MPGKSGSSGRGVGQKIGEKAPSTTAGQAATGGVAGAVVVAADSTPEGQQFVDSAAQAAPSSAPAVTSPIPGVPPEALATAAIVIIALILIGAVTD